MNSVDRVLEEQIFAELVKKFLTFRGTLRFITTSTVHRWVSSSAT
jgi:hypothetical protein